MRALTGLSAALALLAWSLCPVPAPAQDATSTDMPADAAAMEAAWVQSMTPGPQHEAMAELAGQWRVTVRVWLDPSAEPQVSEGRADRAMILGRRMMEERFSGTFEGEPYEGLGHSGYDNVTGRYWSTWMDNMSTGVAVFHGDFVGETLVFEGEVPNPMAGGLIPMRIESRMDGPDREINEFYQPPPGAGPDAGLVKTLELVYGRE